MWKFKFIISFYLILNLSGKLFAQMIVESDSNLIITTNCANLVISKFNGMLTSAKLSGIDFEISSDHSDYCLFFTEFAIQFEDSTGEIFTTSNRKTFGGIVNIIDLYETQTFARIKFQWENKYIITRWSYHFYKQRKYFYINVDREVRTSWVYANHQQCIMTNPDFDNIWMVNYANEWFQTMDHGNVGPFAQEREPNFQHAPFSAIDQGRGVRFPAYGWYQSDLDVTFGFIITSVSANQRATFSYHGGGRTPEPRHPGFSEVQLNWFGKSDTEALFLRQGTKYSMQLIYYLSQGSIDSLDNFNRALFNDSHYDRCKAENYWAASWGGRHVYLGVYTWVYPQASNNFICSQELFRHRSISIPRSQNGTADPHLFDIFNKAIIDGYVFDLSPVPQYNDSPLLHKTARTLQEPERMQGEVVWEKKALKSHLGYQVFANSDKLNVTGSIYPTEACKLHKAWIEVPFLPRVRAVKKINDFTWDVRASDVVYGTVGITLYDMQGIRRVKNNGNRLELILHEDYTGKVYDVPARWDYSFKLFPHREFTVEEGTEITPFFQLPTEYYREYYQTFPELNFDPRFGIRSDNRIAIFDVNFQPDSIQFLTVRGVAEPGEYSMFLLDRFTPIEAIRFNGELLAALDWQFDPASGRLTIATHWNGPFEMAIYREILITKFSVTQENGKRVLRWETNFQAPNLSFNIYRTTDLHDRKVLNSKSLKEQQFVDKGPAFPGPGKYELELIFCGIQIYGGCVELNTPTEWELISDNFPNPFNAHTYVWLDIKQQTPVQIQIFNARGQLVKSLIDEILEPKFHQIEWNGTDNNNQVVPSGIYFYRIVANGQEKTKKMLLLR